MVEQTHLKNMLVKFDHFHNSRGDHLKVSTFCCHNLYCWMVNFHDPESGWNIIPKLASNAIFIRFSGVSVWGSCCQLIISHHQFLWCLTRTQLLEVSRDVAFRFAAIDLRQVEQFWRLVEGLNEKDSCNWCDGHMIAWMILKKIQ